MSRRWTVEIEGKEYRVEIKYGTIMTSGSGEALVDGQLVDAWGSSFLGLPRERNFEIAGRKAILRRVGNLNQNLELFVLNEKVHRIE